MTQPNEKEAAFLEALGEQVVGHMQRAFPGHRACILASRIAIEAAHRLGFPLRAMTSRVVAMNAQMWRNVECVGRMPDKQELIAWEKQDGSWAVGIGFPWTLATVSAEIGGWNNHLIAVGETCFLDAASRQLARPQRDLPVPPYLVGPYHGPLQRMIGRLETGVVMNYELLPEDTSYITAPDWQERTRRQGIVDEIVAQLVYTDKEKHGGYHR